VPIDGEEVAGKLHGGEAHPWAPVAWHNVVRGLLTMCAGAGGGVAVLHGGVLTSSGEKAAGMAGQLQRLGEALGLGAWAWRDYREAWPCAMELGGARLDWEERMHDSGEARLHG
jgi:hypothetical protein